MGNIEGKAALALAQKNASQLTDIVNEKADKTSIFTMDNMGQDVRIAMTGGSVAVVGINTILEPNIVDKQVTPRKTAFMTTKLIDNCVILENKKIKSVSGTYGLNDDTSGFVLLIPLSIATVYRFNYPKTDTRYAWFNTSKQYINSATESYSDLYGLSSSSVKYTISVSSVYIGVNFDYVTVNSSSLIDVNTLKVSDNKSGLSEDFYPFSLKKGVMTSSLNSIDKDKWIYGIKNYSSDTLITGSDVYIHELIEVEQNVKYYTNIGNNDSTTVQFLCLDADLNIVSTLVYDSTGYANKVGITITDSTIKYITPKISSAYYTTNSASMWFSKYDMDLYKETFEYGKVFNPAYLRGLYDSVRIIPQNTSYYYRDKNISFLGDSLTALGSGSIYAISTARALGFNSYQNYGIGGTAVEVGIISDQYVANNTCMVSDYRVGQISENTDYLVIMAGTNGIGELGDLSTDNYDVTTFVGAYNVMLSKIYYRFGQAGFYSGITYTGVTKASIAKDIKIIIITPPNAFGTDPISANKLNTRGEALKIMCDLWGLPILDSKIVMQMNVFNKTLSFNNIYADSTHFNIRAHKELANGLVGLFRSIEPIDYGSDIISTTITL